jgi:hypothetical protein
VNLLGDNTDTIKRNTETLVDISKEVGLDVNTEKTKVYIAVSSPEWQHHELKIANKAIKNVTQFKHLGTTVTNQNLIDSGGS